jgi:hypothetical protein
LCLDHLLGLVACGVEPTQHLVERGGKLGHLVLGVGHRQAPRGVARRSDLPGGGGQ